MSNKLPADRIKEDAERYANPMVWVNQNPKGEEQLFYEYIASTSYIAGATAEADSIQPVIDAAEKVAKLFAHKDGDCAICQLANALQQWKEGKEVEPEKFTRFALECAITAIPLSVLKSEGEYFKAGNGKQFVAFRWDEDENNARLSIREDGDTRYVFNGLITSLNDFKKAWELTVLIN